AAAAVLVRTDWNYAQTRLAAWEKEFANQPDFLEALAEHYRDNGPLVKAEAALKRVIDVAPDVWRYRDLARVYRSLGDTDGYVQTLEKALEQPEMGLAHTRVRVELARHFMDKKEWDTALSYAREAARSYSGDSLECLADCYEAMGDLERAEEWVRKCAERYQQTGYEWFFWCKRTGVGDVEAAARLAKESLESKSGEQSTLAETTGVFLLLSRETAKAVDVFRTDFDRNHNPYTGLHCALLLDESGDHQGCEWTLQAIVERGERYKSGGEILSQEIDLAHLMQTAIADNGKLKIDAVESLIKRAGDAEGTNLEYFVGRFLELHGEKEHGREFLLRAARSASTNKYNHILACDRLRRQGVKLDTQPAESQPAASQPSGARQQS
ncbi:MAG: hypothetical protein HY718_01305, partial [Planctomycetes bacterium]|nr:hypothetical protein [Planctomycetota bacterium]